MCKPGCSHGCVVIKDARVMTETERARRALAHIMAAQTEIEVMAWDVAATPEMRIMLAKIELGLRTIVNGGK